MYCQTILAKVIRQQRSVKLIVECIEKEIVVVAITSNLRLADAPGNVRLTKRASGLPKRSVVNVSQLMTLDKTFLEKKVKRLTTTEFAKVEAGIRLVLSLT